MEIREVEASCIRMSVASRSSEVIVSCCSILGRSHLSSAQFWDSVAQKRQRQFRASLAENHKRTTRLVRSHKERLRE